jgi:hypothetical protein
MKDFIPIHIRRQDKNAFFAQQLDVAEVKTETMLVSQMSYTAVYAVFGFLYGAI